MSDEQFLARWSRRKQEAKADHAEPAPEKPAEVQGSASSDNAAADAVLPETDLSNLPPIESIDATTDITAFLRKGIPQELSREALRRAWSADPAIRDFVGLAENAWDFNDPNAMPGFGPLDYSAEQVSALVRRVVEGAVESAGSAADVLAEGAEGGERPEAGFTPPSNPVKTLGDSPPPDEPANELPSDAAASQQVASNEETSLPRRTHGGALPR
jgi:hypothetical protein